MFQNVQCRPKQVGLHLRIGRLHLHENPTFIHTYNVYYKGVFGNVLRSYVIVTSKEEDDFGAVGNRFEI